MRILRRFALMVFLGMFLVLASPATAGAAPLKPAPGPRAATCPDSADLKPDTQAPGAEEAAADYLPINRWSGGTSEFHTRLGASALDDMRQKVARDAVTPLFLTLGNSMWQTSAGITEFAEGFEIANDLGCTADKTAASLGNAVMGSGVVLIALVFAIGMAVKARMSAAGEGQGAKSLGRSIAVLAIFAGMLVAANRTASTNSIAAGSPAWLITKTNSVVTDIADPVIKAAADQSPGVNGFSPANSIDPSKMSCMEYRAALHDAYVKALPGESSTGGVPLVISALWEQSGLRAWEISQFGARSPFGEYASCRLLERASGVPFREQWKLIEPTATGLAAPAKKTLVGNDQTDTDQRMVFFGACRWDGSSWSVAQGLNGDIGWTGVSRGGNEITPDKCAAAWSANDRLADAFEWVDEPADIEKRTTGADKVGDGSEQAADYMYSLHGDSVTSAIGVSFAYFVTSLIVLIVLGALAIGVIIAKVMLIVMAALSLLMIPWAAFSQDGLQKLVRFAKFALGAMVYSFALQFILVLMTVITAFLARVGYAAIGSGNIGSVIWTGISPVLALVLIKFLFTKVMHAPDPLRPSTVAAFGGAMGGVGGAAIGNLFSRMGNRAANPGQSGRPSGGGINPEARDQAMYGPRKRFATEEEQAKHDRQQGGAKPEGPGKAGKPGPKGAATTTSPPKAARPKGAGAAQDVRKPRRPTGDTGTERPPKNPSLLGRTVDSWDASHAKRRRAAKLAAAAGVTAWAGAGGLATLGAMAFTPLGGAAVIGAAAYYGRRQVQRHRQQRHMFRESSTAASANARRGFDEYLDDDPDDLDSPDDTSPSPGTPPRSEQPRRHSGRPSGGDEPRKPPPSDGGHPEPVTDPPPPRAQPRRQEQRPSDPPPPIFGDPEPTTPQPGSGSGRSQTPDPRRDPRNTKPE